GTKTEAGQQTLRKGEPVARIQHRNQLRKTSVGGLPGILHSEINARAGRKSLGVVEVRIDCILLQRSHAGGHLIGERKDAVLVVELRSDLRIIGTHRGAGSDSRLHQSTCSGPGATRTAGSASSPGPGRARAKAANA